MFTTLRLPEYDITPDEQRALAWGVALIEPATALLRVLPTRLELWQALLLGLAAERTLWEGNLRLVMRIAIDANRRGHGDVDELFQEGCLALRDAIRKYRPELGYRLSTYAHGAIARRMQHFEQGSTYVSDSRHFRALRRHHDDAEQSPTVNPLALARRADPEVLDRLVDPTDPYEDIDRHGTDFVALLAPRHSAVLRMRFGLDGEVWPQDAIARHFGVSTSTISRWEQLAIEEARSLLSQDRMVSRRPVVRPSPVAAVACDASPFP
ncbi:sigma-70 family RNA polymerase sigma factor [uncultured Tessaracoccus sp.]|uniref:sigma-70 family RNA polymerase sigma factor n=1 Tax=uncultured Tessaracoccus sp. TaxID=905023 RepID=UPI0025F7E223|nr:sigma-70 family RNA polymerase sigma factor [uncultured Tessaracoccus sp.]